MLDPDVTEEKGPRVLVVDDEPAARSAMAELLREEGYTVRSAGDAYKALGQLDDFTPDVMITDVQMPGMSGIELMKRLRERVPDVGVIVMTAFASVENAVAAMRAGADDYLSKPVHFPELCVVLERLLAQLELRRENAQLREVIAADEADDVGWVGRSTPSRDLMSLVRQVASSAASVLVIGESGTGKELVARALHRWGDRREGPFMTLHCATLAEDLLEGELFGYGKGAFPGADEPREGLFSRAQGGTLFLDEVADIPLRTQAKLLRALQDRAIEPAGSDGPRELDVRIVATTQRDLQAEVEAGRFREDLFFRLNVITLRTPTLRERRDDLPLLSMHFLRRHAAKNRKPIRGFSDRALGVLMSYDWPGNVRQLENSIERAVVLCRGTEIEPKDLPRDIMAPGRSSDEAPKVPGTSMEELEKYAILKTLEHVGGSTRKAAEILGISTRKIQYRLSEYRENDPSGLPAVLSAKTPAANSA
jgi:DNA-binding NtrC family response regulator